MMNAHTIVVMSFYQSSSALWIHLLLVVIDDGIQPGSAYHFNYIDGKLHLTKGGRDILFGEGGEYLYWCTKWIYGTIAPAILDHYKPPTHPPTYIHILSFHYYYYVRLWGSEHTCWFQDFCRTNFRVSCRIFFWGEFRKEGHTVLTTPTFAETTPIWLKKSSQA